MNIEKVKKLNIPTKPGCYLYKNKDNKIIYVGKAVNLRSRVLSYWRTSTNHSPAKHSMLKQIYKIEWIEVDTEIEALLLEVNLIKKYQPNYNVVLRDDKRFIYIKISTNEKWSRIYSTRVLDKSGRYFGPFTSTRAVRETINIIRRIWSFRSCKNLPKKVCLYYRIGKCPGMCEYEVDKKAYNKTIKHITLLLEGKKKKIIKDMEKEIKDLENIDSNNEKLYVLKYRLLNLKKVLAHSRVLSVADKYAADVIELAKILNLKKVPNRIEGYDISSTNNKDGVGSMVVFNNGEPNKNEYRKFKIKNDKLKGDTWMLKEILERRFKKISSEEIDDKWPAPDLIVIDGGKQQLNVLLKVLKGFKIDIFCLAISKGEHLRSSVAPDKLFFPGEKKPLELPLSSPALHIVKRVRDEAHRFAITYHKKLRGKNFFK